MEKKILLINDLPGYGRVALSAMMPILSNMGYQLYNLPTALISNTLNYGKFEILDTTDYMINTLKVWEKLGLSFQALSTGFILSENQMEFLMGLFKKQSERGVILFCDPVMGDVGKLYNGVSEKIVDGMRNLVKYADYIVPNYTEASFLSGIEYTDGPLEEDDVKGMMDSLRNMGAKSVVVTSVRMGKGSSVAGYDDKKKEYFILPYEPVPGRFPGTGDLFSAVMMGEVLRGTELKYSVKAAMDFVRDLIDRKIVKERI